MAKSGGKYIMPAKKPTVKLFREALERRPGFTKDESAAYAVAARGGKNRKLTIRGMRRVLDGRPDVEAIIAESRGEPTTTSTGWGAEGTDTAEV